MIKKNPKAYNAFYDCAINIQNYGDKKDPVYEVQTNDTEDQPKLANTFSNADKSISECGEFAFKTNE